MQSILFILLPLSLVGGIDTDNLYTKTKKKLKIKTHINVELTVGTSLFFFVAFIKKGIKIKHGVLLFH